MENDDTVTVPEITPVPTPASVVVLAISTAITKFGLPTTI
jgi:hypothetical protein